jgi:hypothetical protein
VASGVAIALWGPQVALEGQSDLAECRVDFRLEVACGGPEWPQGGRG